MLNTLILGQALIGTRVHGWGDARKATQTNAQTKPAPSVTVPVSGNQTR